MQTESALAIGVDGGASGVRALAVRRRTDGFLEAAGPCATREHGAFTPIDLARQRDEAPDPDPDEAEIEAARARVAAAADVVREALRAADAGERRIVVGLCWPGSKTPDERGVAVMRNGPRDVHLLDDFERQLAARGLELARPIPPLASDGVAGALGERWAARGLLHGVRDALYLAGGSGLAEAVLAGGRVRALDDFAVPLPKAWQTAFDGAGTYEDALSPGGWSRQGRVAESMLPREGPGRRVDWVLALRTDPQLAADVLGRAARALARYVLDRLDRLREPYGVVPVRAVVGARLGEHLAHRELAPALFDRAVESLARSGLPRDFLRPSLLREAPCFGAAALALGSEEAPCPS